MQVLEDIVIEAVDGESRCPSEDPQVHIWQNYWFLFREKVRWSFDGKYGHGIVMQVGERDLFLETNGIIDQNAV